MSHQHLDGDPRIVWYEGLGFDIGARVLVTNEAERIASGVMSGNVVGFEASGPRPGEGFIRVLVQPDGAEATIVALPPQALASEEGSELSGLARAIMNGLEQSMAPDRFSVLLTWLAGSGGRSFAADPEIRRQRVRAGNLMLPGLVFPELVELAATRLADAQ